MDNQQKPEENTVDTVTSISEALAILIQGVKISVDHRTNGLSIYSLADIGQISQAIDYITQSGRPTPKISSITEAASVLIQAVLVGQEHGAYIFEDARLIAEAVDFLTIPQEDNEDNGSKSDFIS